MKQIKPVLLLAFLILFACTTASYANNDSLTSVNLHSTESGNHVEAAGAPVAPFGTPIFSIFAKVGPFSAADRARLNEQQIRSIAESPFYQSDSIRVFKSELAYAIMYGEAIITSVFDEDARLEHSTKEIVARYREVKIIHAIQQQRKSTNLGAVLKNAGISIALLVTFILLIVMVNRFFRLLSRKMIGWQDKIMKVMRLKEYAFFNKQRQLVILLVMLKVMRWLIILLLFVATVVTIFFLLPWTKSYSITFLGYIINPLKNILVSIWQYLPNLITIAVILFVVRLIIRLFKFLKVEIEKETLKIPGFYPDWALPTFNIFRVLIVLFSIVAIWPYLPGSNSQVFQGVSVFLGLVFSLTSASALSNFMAGLTLTYTRAFKLGDRVKIGDVTGDIIEKSMLVTKIKTIKNEEITVPNTKIMNTEVINYSTCAPDKGLILHTTVTIGYDAPWRIIHQLLIDAALQTNLILKEPAPFVFQTALNDFYVSYQLNAYTRAPNEMALIFSQLHQNIQDSFNKAGVEIMSPHYGAIRDGNTIAIPEENRKPGYTPDSFNIKQH